MATETEIKLRIQGSADGARELLERLGYRIRSPRVLETNQLFDRVDGQLRASCKVLRLRSAGGMWTVTYKGPRQDGPYKSREEIELRVEDGLAMEQVLQALGYHATFRYEKYRTVFAREGESGVVTLDETLIGNFFELEGPGDWIDRTTHSMGFLKNDYVLSTYAELYVEYRKQNPQPPPNMVFFKGDSTS